MVFCPSFTRDISPFLKTKMLGFKFLGIFALLTPLALSAPSSLSKRAVSQAVLDDLVLYTKYASALELTTGSCPKPLNSTLVVQVSFMLSYARHDIVSNFTTAS